MTTSDIGLLFLHGLPFDSRMWQNQLCIMPQKCVAPNLYGFGNNIRQWAAKSLDLVEQDRLIVVGCSVGGSCALEVINLAPDRVAAAVLIGTKARCDPDPEALCEALEIVKDQGVAGAWYRFWSSRFRNDDVALGAKNIALEQSVTGLENGLTAFHTRPSREDVVKESTIPIHVVTGDQDTLPGLNYSRRLAGLADQGHFHVIKDCGHYVPMMQPVALNSLISNVIKEADARVVHPA